MENNFTGQRIVRSKTKDVTISGLLIALVFIATKFINLRLPISMNGGLIHLGNTMLFMAAIIFGKKKGALAGSVGMALFDMVSGWMAWAPFTFIVRGIMGYVIGSISHSGGRNGNNLLWNIAAILIGGIWMICGYYVTEVVLYGNWISPVTSIPGNVVQIIAGAVLGLPIITTIKKTKLF